MTADAAPRFPEAPDADAAAGWARREVAAGRPEMAGHYAFYAGHAACRLGRSRATPQFDDQAEAALRRRWLEGFDVAQRRAKAFRPGMTYSAHAAAAMERSDD